MSTTSRTVCFNVGGQLFQVSRSLLDRYKTTVLAVMVSERWQDDPNSSIFIDRDGEHFRHILNYLRYGSVSLPLSVSKEDFLHDMDFYCIPVTEGSVEETRFVSMQTMIQAITQGSSSLQSSARALARGGESLAAAKRCLAELATTAETVMNVYQEAQTKNKENLNAQAFALVGSFLAWMTLGSALGLVYGGRYVVRALMSEK